MLVSEEYRKTLKRTHKSAGEKGWGNTANTKFYKIICQLITKTKSEEVLDYGAGWGGLKAALADDLPHVTVHEYEPSRDDCCEPPAPCDFVICSDVLEHVEPDLIDNVIDDLVRVISDTGYITIHMGPAKRTLPDGRNAHLIQEEFDWWIQKLAPKFRIRLARHPHWKKLQCDFILQSREKYSS